MKSHNGHSVDVICTLYDAQARTARAVPVCSTSGAPWVALTSHSWWREGWCRCFPQLFTGPCMKPRFTDGGDKGTGSRLGHNCVVCGVCFVSLVTEETITHPRRVHSAPQQLQTLWEQLQCLRNHSTIECLFRLTAATKGTYSSAPVAAFWATADTQI